MIYLDYTLSKDFDRGAQGVDLRTASDEQFLYMTFFGDVFFRIDDADFSAPWGWVPIITFALWLWRASVKASAHGMARVRFTESDAEIWLRSAEDDLLAVNASYVSERALVRGSELVDATSVFLRRVVTELSRLRPALDENPFVASMLLELEAAK